MFKPHEKTIINFAEIFNKSVITLMMDDGRLFECGETTRSIQVNASGTHESSNAGMKKTITEIIELYLETLPEALAEQIKHYAITFHHGIYDKYIRVTFTNRECEPVTPFTSSNKGSESVITNTINVIMHSCFIGNSLSESTLFEVKKDKEFRISFQEPTVIKEQYSIRIMMDKFKEKMSAKLDAKVHFAETQAGGTDIIITL